MMRQAQHCKQKLPNSCSTPLSFNRTRWPGGASQKADGPEGPMAPIVTLVQISSKSLSIFIEKHWLFRAKWVNKMKKHGFYRLVFQANGGKGTDRPTHQRSEEEGRGLGWFGERFFFGGRGDGRGWGWGGRGEGLEG